MIAHKHFDTACRYNFTRRRIGAGGIAQAAHIPAWNKAGKAEIVAIADINQIKLRDVQERLGIERGFNDYRELLALPDIDAAKQSSLASSLWVLSAVALRQRLS